MGAGQDSRFKVPRQTVGFEKLCDALLAVVCSAKEPSPTVLHFGMDAGVDQLESVLRRGERTLHVADAALDDGIIGPLETLERRHAVD